MIRGPIATLLLLLALLALAKTTQFEQLQVTKAHRTITLSGSYAGENVRINFVANDDSVDHFTYLIPQQYDSQIAKIWFSKSQRDKRPLDHSKTIFSYEGHTYAKYRAALPHNHQIGDFGQIFVHIVYLYRYNNLPATITLQEDQKLQFEDIKYLVSPYHISDHETTYKFAKIFQHDSDGQRKGTGQVIFSTNSLEPFAITKHTVFGVNNNPQVQFTTVEKVIQISHWGNVGLTESYKIVNKGPSLKGEFSRITFGNRGNQIRNAFKGIDFELPYQIWGLHYSDEVGNISTSKAWRDDGSNSVRVSLMPRFGLLGGWKSNWVLGYNLNTDGHLFRTGNQYELKDIKLEYALQRVLAQKFTVKVVLPEGAQNVKLTIGSHTYTSESLEVTTTEGYLDFNGRPTFIIPNYQGVTEGKNIQVSYTFSANRVFQKPIALFVIIFSFLCFAIFWSRFKLQAFADAKED